MDSITQATLGAAVGEAFLGKKVGYRAAVWGVFLGTLPDLDIIVNPFVDNVVELRNHRGFTHSIMFSFLAAPISGWLIDKVHRPLKVGWIRWSIMSFFIFSTHILIDLPTTYGTQILHPFSDTPFALDSIFIIDPLFTIPLLTGLVIALILNRDSHARMLANRTGLLFSTLYLVLGFGLKSHVHSVFTESFQNQYGSYEQVKTTPNGPSTILWTGYVEKQDTIYNAVYSIFDKDPNLNFSAIPKNSYLIEPYRDHQALQALLWFSRGYYTAELEGDQLVFYDLRFGRGDFWLTESEDYVWKNYVMLDENDYAYTFEQAIPNFSTRTLNLSRYWQRLWKNPQ